MLYILLKDALTGASRALASILSLEGAAAAMSYDNSTLTITSVGTPDPFVTLFRGRYYLVSICESLILSTTTLPLILWFYPKIN